MGAKIEIYNPETLAKPLGLYRHVARARASEYLHIAGQVAVDDTGELVGIEDIEAQLRQTYANLQAALKSAGADFANVVKYTTYLVRSEDIADYKRMREQLYAEFYPDGAYPPNTLLIVSALVSPDMLVEIEAVAAI